MPIGGMIFSNELERSGMGYCKVLFQHLPGGTKENFSQDSQSL
jgi:hypothetical protein